MMEHHEREVEFSSVLSDALSLSTDDQRQLCAVLVRVIGEHAASAAIAPTGEIDPSEPDAAEWLQQIKAESPWTRVSLLDTALGQAEDAAEREVLTDALNALLKANPPLVIRRAVVQVAADHPLGICAGATGLALAILAIGKGVIRLLF
jgi:hypothetical protein